MQNEVLIHLVRKVLEPNTFYSMALLRIHVQSLRIHTKALIKYFLNFQTLYISSVGCTCKARAGHLVR